MRMGWNTNLALLLVLSVGISLAACKPKSNSSLKNIYSEDASSRASGNSRRHSATENEATWAVDAACGSAILLDASHLLQAAHCDPQVGEKYSSGLAIIEGRKDDIVARKLLETNADLDFVIVEIEWLDSLPDKQKFPPYIAIDDSEVLFGAETDQGDFLFTVGFPNDKDKIWPVTYAEGQAKYLRQQTLFYDVGVINGNSGGPLFKKDNNMLVGLVTGGANEYEAKGWDQSDRSDPQVWNKATPTWEIYKVSPVLRSLFPDGKHHTLTDVFVPKTRIYLAVEASSEGDYVWVSVGHETKSVLMCSGSLDSCRTGAKGAESLTFKDFKQDRKFFRSKETKVGLSGKKISFIALDQNGKQLARRRVQMKKEN